LNSTRQSVNVSESAVTEAQTGIATAQANIDAANVRVWKATEDYNRYKNLYDDHAITKAQLDAVQAEKESAEAALAAAKSQVPVVTRKVGTGREQTQAAASNVALRNADIDYAKLQLSYTVITAPVSGIVSKRNIQVGQLVQAGQALFAVVKQNGMYITANFKETQMSDLRVGEKVDINVDAFSDTTITGTIESFSGATGAKFSLLPPDNATGNFVKVVQRIPVRIKFDTTDIKFIDRLRPGMSVKAVVHTK